MEGLDGIFTIERKDGRIIIREQIGKTVFYPLDEEIDEELEEEGEELFTLQMLRDGSFTFYIGDTSFFYLDATEAKEFFRALASVFLDEEEVED